MFTCRSALRFMRAAARTTPMRNAQRATIGGAILFFPDSQRGVQRARQPHQHEVLNDGTTHLFSRTRTAYGPAPECRQRERARARPRTDVASGRMCWRASGAGQGSESHWHHHIAGMRAIPRAGRDGAAAGRCEGGRRYRRWRSCSVGVDPTSWSRERKDAPPAQRARWGVLRFGAHARATLVARGRAV